MRKSLARVSDTCKWRLPYSLEEQEEHSMGKAPAGPVLTSPQGGMGVGVCWLGSGGHFRRELSG